MTDVPVPPLDLEAPHDFRAEWENRWGEIFADAAKCEDFVERCLTALRDARQRIANLDAAAEPGTIAARYRGLGQLAAPAGYHPTMAAPPEKFIAERIEKLKATLAAAAERESRLREAGQRVLNETFASGSLWINKDRIAEALAQLERALSPTPPEAPR